MKLNIILPILIYGLIPLTSYAQNVGNRIVDKDELVDMLKPQAQIRTRGIRLNQPAQAPAPVQGAVAQDYSGQAEQAAAAAAAAAAPSISMNVQFGYNSADLTQSAVEQLNPLGEALSSSELSSYSFLLEGHTDSSGAADYNMQLSQRRAESVGNYLYQNFGIDPSSLNLVGRGEDALLDPNNPSSPSNRRVSITTITQ
jgi:outer membrane protein OmpA-like peptidoglycan-associated protein